MTALCVMTAAHAMYCLHAVKSFLLTLKKRLRAVIGANALRIIPITESVRESVLD